MPDYFPRLLASNNDQLVSETPCETVQTSFIKQELFIMLMLDEIGCQAKVGMPTQDFDLISLIDALATTTNNSFSIK